jgi:hypothetical protein
VVCASGACTLPAREPLPRSQRATKRGTGDTFRHRPATLWADGQKEMLHMRMRNLWMWTTAVALAAGTLPAAAGPLFSWTAEDGTVSYTDDAKRIPERYRAGAKQVPAGKLDGYARLSPAEPAAQSEYVAQLTERLARLRALNRALDEDAAYEAAAAAGYGYPGAPAEGPETLVRVGRDLQVRVPQTASASAPVVVEDVRVRPDGSVFTTHDTVVRQGDRILMVVKGNRQTWGPGFGVRSQSTFDYGDNDVVDEQELIGEHFLWNRD